MGRHTTVADSLVEAQTLIGLLQERVQQVPTKRVYTYLGDTGQEEASLTYSELEIQARTIAAALQMHAAQGERAILLYPQGLEFIAAFFGCLYSGVIAVPAYPPHPSRLDRSISRLQSILDDATPTVVLTTTTICSYAHALFLQAPQFARLRWLPTDDLHTDISTYWRQPRVTPQSLAFLQYTSGSTATPKGVMVSHANLLHNEGLMHEAFQTSPETVVAGWLPLYHDMGLIGNVLHPLFVGGSCVLMSPSAFIQRPIGWLEMISKYQATISGGPNFAYELCVRRTTPEDRAALDLSQWRVAFNGAEPVRYDTMQRFGEAFAVSGFRPEAFFPCYGLAEATLFVSGSYPDQSPQSITVESTALSQHRVQEMISQESFSQTFISCGTPANGQHVVIVDPETSLRAAENQVGEIWVGGPSIAQGYWKRAEATQNTFQARLAPEGEGPFLRTGDLGFLHQGHVYVTGRIKDLIIIRGRNHYPQDIEATVEASHPYLRPTCCGAFSFDVSGEERLVVAVEIEPRSLRLLRRSQTQTETPETSPNQTEAAKVIQAVRQAVAEKHELQVYGVVLLEPGSLPKTSSGKVQRHRCRIYFEQGTFKTVTQNILGEAELNKTLDTNPREEYLALAMAERWNYLSAYVQSEVSQALRIPRHQVALQHNLAALGIDSLSAIELKHRLESTLGVPVALTLLLGNHTIRDLIDSLIEQLNQPTGTVSKEALLEVHKASESSLSYGQKALWFLYKMSPQSAAYNLSHALKIQSEFDSTALQQAFQKLVHHHSLLRSTFIEVNGEPQRQVWDNLPICFSEEDVTGLSDVQVKARLVEEAHRPFDLEQGPLMRVFLFRKSPQESVLLLTLHHIVADFWSLSILIKELGVLYAGEVSGHTIVLMQPEAQYADFVFHQTHLVEHVTGQKHLKYWQEKLLEAKTVLDLPTDRPRPNHQTFEGASVQFSINESLTSRIAALARMEGTTIYSTLLAAFQAVLHRYSQQDDILVGSPTLGRDQSRFARTFGYFVNPVVLRGDFSRNPTFREFLTQMRQTVAEALEHQDYPFPLLVEKLQPQRDPSRSPLFQVMFAWHQVPDSSNEGLAALAVGKTGVKMDLGGLPVESLGLEQEVVQCDLTLVMAEVGGCLTGTLQYNTDLFDASTIFQFQTHFQTLLENIVKYPNQPIATLPLLSKAERHQILFDWNATSQEVSPAHCLHQLFEIKARQNPNLLAVVSDDGRLTYQEANQRANQLAHYLIKAGLKAGDLVGVCFDRSVDLIVSILGILKVGAAYVPLDPVYPKQRLAFMLQDARVGILLTHSHLMDTLPENCAHLICLDTAWPALQKESGDFASLPLSPSQLAYVIYTSGSTGTPKGVCVPHGGVIHLLFDLNNRQPLIPGEGCSCWTSFSFDVSVYEVFSALCFGGTLFLPSDLVRLHSELFFDWLKTNQISSTYIPPFMLKDFADWLETQAHPIALRRLLVGVEPIPESLLSNLMRLLPGLRVVNGYGPTETSICATLYSVPEHSQRDKNTPIGRPVDQIRVYVLDQNLEPIPVGVAGEVYIGGEGLAWGYLNNSELTAERFLPDPFSPVPGARCYKTGDLARFLPDGNLEFLGRRDHQVKIRGHRIELGEIETTLLQHEELREALVVTLPDALGHQRLVAYVVPKTQAEQSPTQCQPKTLNEGLRNFLKLSLPDFMIPTAFVVLEAFPLSPNGKIDRQALPVPNLSTNLSGYVAPRNQVEELIAEIWASVLKVEQVGIYSNFFDLGGHSLLATQIISRVRDVFKVDLPLKCLFEAQTVAEFTQLVQVATHEKHPREIPPITPVGREHPLPLSYSQQRLWFLDQYEPGNAFYNMPGALRLSGELNCAALELSLNQVVSRHEALRTNFVARDGKPVQIMVPERTILLELEDLTHLEPSAQEVQTIRLATDEAQKPFDLSQGSLIRAKLLRLSLQDHVLLVTLHHIVSDGWSIGVLAREVASLYSALIKGETPQLEQLSLQYGDYAVWQREWLQHHSLQKQVTYWKEQLGENLPVLELPTDHPRPAVQTFKGERLDFVLATDLTRKLKALSQREGVTLFMTLLAGFKALLSRLSGQPEIVVGSPIANRNHSEIEGLIGFFVNTLVLRTRMSGDPTFRQLVKRVREVTLSAYANQDVPFEMIVDELQPERDPSRNPLFQVMFQLENTPKVPLTLPGLTISHVTIDKGTTQFDLSVDITESEKGLELFLEYSTDLFDPPTISRLMDHYQVLLNGVMDNPDLHLSEFPLLRKEELHQVLVEWNQAETYQPTQKCVHELFDAQARKHPEALAVVCGKLKISYAELNRRANQLAHFLNQNGVRHEVLVGVCLDSALEVSVGLLGILKAGGAYLPLDPGYPQSRLEYMLADAGIQILLTEKRFQNLFDESNLSVICLDSDWEAIARLNQHEPFSLVTPANLAYSIYTSGSTGAPKGVLVTHEALVSHNQAMADRFGLLPEDKVLQFASISFDVAAEEIFPTWFSGATLVFPPHKGAITCRDLLNLIERERLTVMNLPAGFWHEWVRELAEARLKLPESLRLVVVGSEKVFLDRYLDWQNIRNSRVTLLNAYGTTEATITSTLFEPGQDIEKKVLGTALPIGKPIGNTKVYLLDRDFKPVPVGVPGELFIDSYNLARGYLNRPELTAEKFIPNVLSDEPGARLYRTGDVARYLPDGNIEILGRTDQQVKVRGFRIETGEVEAALRQHPAVRDTVVMAHQSTPTEKRLVAYLTPNAITQTTEFQELGAQLEAEQLAQWQIVHDDEVFNQTDEEDDPTLNFSGWNSSYTGRPIPKEEMAEWVSQTVQRVLSLRPQRVLEIGCGTGLLLFQIAPKCQYYLGTDFSSSALRHIERVVKATGRPLGQVELSERRADNFEGIEPESFDAVIIHSVIQYFPTVDYLEKVLEGALRVLKPGGFIYLGDVRNLTLLEAFHASISVHQSDDQTTRIQLGQLLHKRIAQEEELVIHPEFFSTLKASHPAIGRVYTYLRRGKFQNEMSKFRYDVILQTRNGQAPTQIITWLDWQKNHLNLEQLKEYLEERRPEWLGVRSIPNARVSQELLAADLLQAETGPETIGELKHLLATTPASEGMDPESIWGISNHFPYQIEISWSTGRKECFDVLFHRRTTNLRLDQPVELFFQQEEPEIHRSHDSLANNPLAGKFSRTLVPHLRQFLGHKLPEFMIPANYILLEEFPLLPNGKVNRRALPAPEQIRQGSTDTYVAPRHQTEESVQKIWTQVLNLDRIGIHDNFFELGGHSLLATQVISRLREAFHVDLPLRSIFEAQTISTLTERIEAALQNEKQHQRPPLKPVARTGALPLSFGQQRLWFLDQMEPGNPFYNMAGVVRLVGPVEIEILEKSLSEVARRHEILRTVFVEVDGNPVQQVNPPMSVKVLVQDLQELPLVEREPAALRKAREAALQSFNLAESPLFRLVCFRLSEAESLLLVNLHHIISDGWSVTLLVQEVATLYGAFKEGKPSPLAELPIQYGDYAVWQREQLQGEILDQQLVYWKHQLQGKLPVLNLPTDRPRPRTQTYAGAQYQFTISSSKAQKLKEFSQAEGVTLYITLLAAFQTLLYRYSGQEDICVGSPIANRTVEASESLIGFFVNTLVIRTDLSGTPSFRKLLNRVKEVALGAYANQDVPFEWLVEALNPERNLSHTPLFQVLFGLQNTPRAEVDLPGLKLQPVELGSVGAKFDLALMMEEVGDSLIASFEYNTDLFDATTIARLEQHFQVLLEGLLAHPHQGIHELPLLTEQEIEQILVEWNQTAAAYPNTVCVHKLFELQAERTPHAVAVVFEGELLTYWELNHRANQLAHHLRWIGVGPEKLVGICVERSLEMLVGMLGILKAGGAYVPLDPGYPQERLAFVVEDANPKVLLTQKHLLEKLPQHRSVVCLDSDWPLVSRQSTENPIREVTAENLAYVIYTSGSTGKPKGVEIVHRNVVNFFYGMDQRIGIGPEDTLLAVTSFSFDISVLELFWTLVRGARVVLASEKAVRSDDTWGDAGDSYSLPELARDFSVTHLQCTPSTLKMVSLTSEVMRSFHTLKTLLLGGEALSPAFARQIKEVLPCRMVNMYGPTETTIWSSTYEVTEIRSSIPIGKPIINTQMLILDAHLRPVPVGVAGELYLGGDGLARGYLNRPELTSERFVTVGGGQQAAKTSSFITHRPSLRLYRTGDLVRWLPDGNIEFLGRVDHQVKLRGFRIELGEIEHTLQQCQGVQDVAVVAREDLSTEQVLVAYVIPDGQSGDQSSQIQAWRDSLKTRLPEYMVPSIFVVMEAFPLTPNGKLDRKALPKPDQTRLTGRAEFVAPQTPVELKVASIWSELLGITEVGLHDHFFESGGHSLLATQLVSRLRQLFPVKLPLQAIFETPTVSQLSGRIEELLLEHIESLSEEEAERLVLTFFQEN